MLGVHHVGISVDEKRGRLDPGDIIGRLLLR
jgi:hypothetical protein